MMIRASRSQGLVVAGVVVLFLANVALFMPDKADWHDSAAIAGGLVGGLLVQGVLVAIVYGLYRLVRRSEPRLSLAMVALRTLAFLTVTKLITMAYPGGRNDKLRERAPASVSALLFDGSGTSPNDVAAVAALLRQRGIPYATASSSQLNAMSDSQLGAYRLLVVPGGNFVTMGKSLAPGTAARVRVAVQHGTNYLGLCAGGLLAGDIPGLGLNLTSGTRFAFYRLVEQDIHRAGVLITTVDGPAITHYWEDGPQLSGWGDVVARFPDGTPAIAEGRSGSGWVILTGTHPEAPEAWWRGMSPTTSPGAANAYASTIVAAAFNGTPLPHF